MKANLPAREGGAPVRSEFLPFARASIGPKEIESVVKTLESGWLTLGPRTREFEKVVAEYVGVDEAAGVHSCTAGLHLAMVVLGVSPGDDVVLPALNFAAGPNMVLHLGAQPVLADVDPETLNVTAETLERVMTDRTRLLMPVHFAGRPCDMLEIVDLAHARGARVLGDAAHAIGADRRGRRVGSTADATSFSFYVTKGITTGEGGMVTSPDPAVATRIRRLALHGMSSDAWKRYGERGPWYYEILEAGYKYNMNDIQAALGLCQMERIDEFREARNRIARIYREGFASLDVITLPSEYSDGHHAWHLFPVQLSLEAVRLSRDDFIQSLLDERIGVSVHFIPVHYHPFYRERLGYARGAFPATERYYERAVSLPIYPSMTDADAADVVEAVTKVLRFYRR
jgi:dTDP-4-amino-4,6-dideoxygalactose transaminase